MSVGEPKRKRLRASTPTEKAKPRTIHVTYVMKIVKGPVQGAFYSRQISFVFIVLCADGQQGTRVLCLDRRSSRKGFDESVFYIEALCDPDTEPAVPILKHGKMIPDVILEMSTVHDITEQKKHDLQSLLCKQFGDEEDLHWCRGILDSGGERTDEQNTLDYFPSVVANFTGRVPVGLFLKIYAGRGSGFSKVDFKSAHFSVDSLYSADFSKCSKPRGVTTASYTNARLTKWRRWPESPVNPLTSRQQAIAKPDTKLVPRATLSQSGNGYAHIERTATLLHLCLLMCSVEFKHRPPSPNHDDPGLIAREYNPDSTRGKRGGLCRGRADFSRYARFPIHLTPSHSRLKATSCFGKDSSQRTVTQVEDTSLTGECLRAHITERAGAVAVHSWAVELEAPAVLAKRRCGRHVEWKSEPNLSALDSDQIVGPRLTGRSISEVVQAREFTRATLSRVYRDFLDSDKTTAARDNCRGVERIDDRSRRRLARQVFLVRFLIGAHWTRVREYKGSIPSPDGHPDLRFQCFLEIACNECMHFSSAHALADSSSMISAQWRTLAGLIMELAQHDQCPMEDTRWTDMELAQHDQCPMEDTRWTDVELAQHTGIEKWTQYETSRINLQRFHREGNSKLNRITAIDETWTRAYSYETELKRKSSEWSFWITTETQGTAKPVTHKNLALSGDGVLDAHVSIARIAPTSFGIKRGKQLQVWAALNIDILRADEGKARRHEAEGNIQTWPRGTLGPSSRDYLRGKREIPEKTHRPVASFGMISTYKNRDAAPSGIEPGSPWWEASSLTTTGHHRGLFLDTCSKCATTLSHYLEQVEYMRHYVGSGDGEVTRHEMTLLLEGSNFRDTFERSPPPKAGRWVFLVGSPAIAFQHCSISTSLHYHKLHANGLYLVRNSSHAKYQYNSVQRIRCVVLSRDFLVKLSLHEAEEYPGSRTQKTMRFTGRHITGPDFLPSRAYCRGVCGRSSLRLLKGGTCTVDWFGVQSPPTAFCRLQWYRPFTVK
ncbi:hypothetical protein PR048_030182 [Dryococelus australis]|uniref:Uncharacterized protein n=1 Tax=Dryococelus australis TaxID=614101 RepID=A0ABQ9G880_9NEOP|nr:hypothetical protein PR048_030182 [Dryococelus australis]